MRGRPGISDIPKKSKDSLRSHWHRHGKSLKRINAGLGHRSLHFGGSSSKSAESVGAEVPRVASASVVSINKVLTMKFLSGVWAAVCPASLGAALFLESSFLAFPMMLWSTKYPFETFIFLQE